MSNLKGLASAAFCFALGVFLSVIVYVGLVVMP